MSLKLTKAGMELLLQAMAGETTLKFLSIQLGNGTDAGEEAVTMTNPLMTLEIEKCTANEDILTLETSYRNQDVEDGFSATELGVLVEDPFVAGNRVLYAYQFTPESSADRIRTVPDAAIETQLIVDVYAGDAEGVTVLLEQLSEYVYRREFENYTARRDNPHQVTAEQVGLGNVQNKEPKDMTVEIVNVPEKDEIVNFKSGEMLGMILGRIHMAIDSLLKHVKNENPHKIEAKTIGAALAEHGHSTNDMTSGVLGICRGGTGGSTAKEARANLGIRSGQCRVEITAGATTFAEFTFDTCYAEGEIPVVVLTPMFGTKRELQIGIYSRSTTGFTVFAYSTTYSGVVNCNWIACL